MGNHKLGSLGGKILLLVLIFIIGAALLALSGCTEENIVGEKQLYSKVLLLGIDGKMTLHHLNFSCIWRGVENASAALGASAAAFQSDPAVDTVEKMHSELEETGTPEMEGRNMEKEFLMQKLRGLGYM